MSTPQTTINKNPATRIQSIDLLRGAVMVLMAIDHVRVYSGLPAGGPSPGIFFTRWVTHFCAPSFVFLAGASAFLYGTKLNDKGKLARYLVTRGLLLVLLELTLIRFFWMFNFAYANFILAGVIWMLGWCMVLLAAFVRLRPATVAIIGLAIIFFQQIFHFAPQILPVGWRTSFGWFWEFIYPSGLNSMPGISILYVLVPWIGVMMTGYGFGRLLMHEPAKLNKYCLRIGISAIVLFIVAGCLFIFFGPSNNNSGMPFIFRLLAQQKYPPSQIFLLMTLGPLIALVPFSERARGWLADVLRLFGRVPMFYYMLHILVIHLSALVINFLREGKFHQEWYTTAPYSSVPEEYKWGLPLLYLVFIIDVTMLYFACRWYAKYKAAHPGNKLLKYI